MVRILGGYQTDFARNWSREGIPLVAPMTESILGCLDAAQVSAPEVETVHVGNFAGELYSMQGHLGALTLEAHLALRGKPTFRHEAACASGAVSILAAMAELEASRYEVALVVGIEQMKTVDPRRGSDYLGTAAWYEREAKGQEFAFPKLFGQLGAEYMRRFRIDREHYEESQAYLSDLMLRNARANPNAQTRSWTTDGEAAERLAMRISPEIRLRDCSQVTDGAAALILASEQFAASYARSHSLELSKIPAILGWGHTTAPLLLQDKLAESQDGPYVLPHAQRAIASAYRRAAIDGPTNLDACEFHDCFTTTAYAAVDLVGLTPAGENSRAILGGWLERDGLLPLNPGGGLIGTGHPVGATGIRQVLDAWKLLTLAAENYQVAIRHSKVLTVNVGGSGTTTVALVVGNP